MDPRPRIIIVYRDGRGKRPFDEWFRALNPATRAMVQVRLTRVSLGLLGDCKSLKGGLHEFRFAKAGLRVYFGIQHSDLVILLGGGTKSNQGRDIAKARRAWREFLSSI